MPELLTGAGLATLPALPNVAGGALAEVFRGGRCRPCAVRQVLDKG